MDKILEGKIKKIRIDGTDVYFNIEYIESENKQVVESIPYSRKFNKYTYKNNDVVNFRLIENNKAKIIDDDLYERGDRFEPSGIYIILIGFFFGIIWMFTKNILFLLPIPLYIVFMLVEVIIHSCNLVNKGSDVRGKIISKKTEFNINIRSDSFYEEIYIEVLYNNKVYKISDIGYDTAKEMKIGDEVEITIYKDLARFTKEVRKPTKVNYRALPLLAIFIGMFVYMLIYGDKMSENLLFVIPLLILVLILFLCIPIVANDKKRKRKRKNKKDL